MTLTAYQADEIRRLHAGAVRARQIGEIVGVSIRTVNDVLSGQRTGRPLSPREQAELDAQQGWRAACMDDVEWAEWIARNPFGGLKEGEQAARPCTDCPLGFAADMRAQGRCNGTPGGVAADPDEPEEEETMEPVVHVKEDPGIRIAVALEAPCGRCEKADVCSLRRDVEALTQLPVLVPVLDRRVGLELAGTVTCSAFVKARIRKADAGELEAKRKPGRPRAMAPATPSDPRVVAPGTTLTPRQAEVLEAFAANGCDRQATAAALGLVYQSVDGALEAIAIKGLLPAEVLDQVPARIRRLQLQDEAVPA